MQEQNIGFVLVNGIHITYSQLCPCRLFRSLPKGDDKRTFILCLLKVTVLWLDENMCCARCNTRSVYCVQ